MKGLDLSQRFFAEHERELMAGDCALYTSAGLIGNGSECFGFDDDVSQDHDFEPGFCLWVDDDAPPSVYADLQSAYECLPIRYNGWKRISRTVSGEKRRGVFRTSDFYRSLIGRPNAPRTAAEWLSLPDYALAAATNGRLFTDSATDFTYIRNTLIHGMPRDVRLKRIARAIALMAQSGQYNFSRCLKHGEPAAARLALGEFVTAAAMAVYHLNDRYPPYYKWLLRGFCTLSVLSDLKDELSMLLLSQNDEVCRELVEEVSDRVLSELKRRELTEGRESYLEPHALRIMKRIRDPAIASLHVMT